MIALGRNKWWSWKFVLIGCAIGCVIGCHVLITGRTDVKFPRSAG